VKVEPIEDERGNGTVPAEAAVFVSTRTALRPDPEIW
jgi:hypothetical protein